MSVQLALSNLRHNVNKTLLSVAGIATALLLIFVQLGFRGAVENTALMIYERMDFDCVVRSPDYLHFISARQIPRTILNEISCMNEVQQVRPLWVSIGNWRHPQGVNLRNIMLMGIDPSDPPFTQPEVARDFDQLNSATAVLIDQQTQSEYGPKDGQRFGPDDIGVTTEVSERNVQIAGLFNMGTGLTANGALITSEAGFRHITPIDTESDVSLGLIQLRPGVDPQQFAAELQKRFRLVDGKFGVEALTRQQVLDRETRRWIDETPIGFIFTLGVLISFVVGAAIVYMVLGNDVAHRLSEYATLKAMGYSNLYLNSVVLGQAFYLALLSFLPSLVVALAFYEVTARLANVPIMMTGSRVIFVFGLSLLMCGLSGALAMRKLWQAQPAELF